MALSSVRKCSPKKWKKNHQIDVSHIKNNKNYSHNKRYKKDIEKGEGKKNEKQKKSLTT